MDNDYHLYNYFDIQTIIEHAYIFTSTSSANQILCISWLFTLYR